MTATLPEQTTVAADAPAIEPENGRRAVVREWRRELADWLRAHGMTAAGAVWDLATTGERDLTTLRRTAADAGELARHWAGSVLPGALADGDSTERGVIVGAPVVDPDTGEVWVVARRVAVGMTDHDAPTTTTNTADYALDPAVPVPVSRGRGNLADRVTSGRTR